MGYIYMFTSPSGKSYIGLTCENNINDRWEGHLKSSSHCTLLKRAMKKYGWDNIKKKILIEFKHEINDKLLPEYEKRFIKAYNTLAPNGYNCTDGGEGGKRYCEETRQNISKGMKKYYEINKNKFSGSISKTRSNKWYARKKENGKTIQLGTWKTKEEAEYAMKIYIDTGKIIKNERKDTGNIRQYTKNGKFFASKSIKNKTVYLGGWDTHEEAQQAIDHFISTGIKLHLKNDSILIQ